MADKSIEQLVEQYQIEHAYNEEARLALGAVLAALPTSYHGLFQWYAEDWGVKVCWHTPSNEVFWAVNLIPHECNEDCERYCGQKWDEVSFCGDALIRAIAQILIARAEELSSEAAEMRKAISAFSKKQIGFAELKASAE